MILNTEEGEGEVQSEKQEKITIPQVGESIDQSSGESEKETDKETNMLNVMNCAAL